MKLTSILTAAGLLVACVTTTPAQTSGPFTTLNPQPSTLTDWSVGLLFPQFDPNLGNLTSVEIYLSSSFTTTLTVQNNALSASSGTARTELQLTVQDPGGNLNIPELDLLSPGFGYSLSPGSQAVSGVLNKNGSDDETYTSGAVLSEFTGLGNISLAASTFTQTVLANSGGNTSADQTTFASLTGYVVYTYTSVPEPASLTLAGLGGLGVLLFRRRQRK